jgi:uncharacterized repeat protein (TIGR03803 family)
VNRLSNSAMALMSLSSLMCWVAAGQTAYAQTFTTEYSFNGKGGAGPYAELVQGTTGELYGTTQDGGASGIGSIFKITTGGTRSTLHSFCSEGTYPDCTDGQNPYAGLVQGTNGDFYGTTNDGGANGGGTVFKTSPGGKLTTLYGFCSQTNCLDGESPYAALIQGTNGDFYGTTEAGGNVAESCPHGCGTIFKMSAGGTLTTLYRFCALTGCADGESPYAGLIEGVNGDFDGTTYFGGAKGGGTVFKVTAAGKLTTLYSFCSQTNCADGQEPYAGLVQASDGNFYGTTQTGGATGDGSVFKITSGGKLTTLYSFCSQADCADGESPYAGLIQATDGNLYGTTSEGGAHGHGSVFQITLGGTLTTQYSFCSVGTFPDCKDGDIPYAGLTQATDGDFYGTTWGGGAHSDGTVFCISLDLGAFVETQTTSGQVGAAVKILGTDLTGATNVTFNGTAATFSLVSASEITTTVPTDATTGFVAVTTPGGTLTSNKPFTVTP